MATEKRYCYRYYDGHDDEGRPVVRLLTCVILRETEKTFWYCDDMQNLTTGQIRGLVDRPKSRGVKLCRKGAARSKYHITREEALRAFVYRKIYQLERISLTAETAQMCLDGLANAGFLKRDEHSEISRFGDVLGAPKDDFTAAQEAGLVASNYYWGDY